MHVLGRLVTEEKQARELTRGERPAAVCGEQLCRVRARVVHPDVPLVLVESSSHKRASLLRPKNGDPPDSSGWPPPLVAGWRGRRLRRSSKPTPRVLSPHLRRI